jgi:hypothetical protein
LAFPNNYRSEPPQLGSGGNSLGKENTPGKENTQGQGNSPASNKDDSKSDDKPPLGPWGDRGVTSRNAGVKEKKDQKDSSLNVRINLDLRADVALELHAVLQGEVIIGLF